MRRAIAIAITGASLAGCSSFSLDSLRPAPQPVALQLESVPPGADAVTSLGPACRTPCSVALAPPENGFTVTFSLPKLQPITVPVQVIRNPGDFTTAATTTITPNPVIAELRPPAPPPKAAKPLRPKPKKPKPPKAATPAPAADSPFPDPSAPPPPPPPPPR